MIKTVQKDEVETHNEAGMIMIMTTQHGEDRLINAMIDNSSMMAGAKCEDLVK